MFRPNRAASRSKPSCVSLTERFAGSRSAAIRSRMDERARRPRRPPRSAVDTLSPSMSRVAVMPVAPSRRTASTAVSSVSPATNREAKRDASGLVQTKLLIRCCLLR